MANTQSMCTSFMGELMTATHNFGTAPIRAATTADTFKAALYLTSATVNAATTAYSSTGEVTGTGYTAGGVTVTNAATTMPQSIMRPALGWLSRSRGRIVALLDLR